MNIKINHNKFEIIIYTYDFLEQAVSYDRDLDVCFQKFINRLDPFGNISGISLAEQFVDHLQKRKVLQIDKEIKTINTKNIKNFLTTNISYVQFHCDNFSMDGKNIRKGEYIALQIHEDILTQIKIFKTNYPDSISNFNKAVITCENNDEHYWDTENAINWKGVDTKELQEYDCKCDLEENLLCPKCNGKLTPSYF